MPHREQAIGASDDWHTPAHVFAALGTRFDLDVAAPPQGPFHVPADRWLSEGGLTAPWRGYVWMNPPFGPRNGLRPWLRRFFEHGHGIALTPDRSSAPWWSEAAAQAEAVLFCARKIRFLRGDGSIGGTPAQGTCLWAAGQRARRDLLRAQAAGLGTVFQPVREDRP